MVTPSLPPSLLPTVFAFTHPLFQDVFGKIPLMTPTPPPQVSFTVTPQPHPPPLPPVQKF